MSTCALIHRNARPPSIPKVFAEGGVRSLNPLNLDGARLIRALLYRCGMKAWVGTIMLVMCVGRAAEISVALREVPTRVFASDKVAIPVLISNKAEAAKPVFEYRVYQLATGVAAPLGDKTAWKEIPLNAGQTVLETLMISIPEPKAPTTFAIKISEAGATKEAGTLKLEVYPKNFLAELKAPLKDFELVLFDDKDQFAKALETAGLEVARLKNLSDPILPDKPAFLFAATTPSDGELADLSKVARVIVCFTDGKNADRLPIEGLTKGRAFIVQIERELLKDFAESPTAQLNFMRAARYALRNAGETGKQE